MSNVHRLLPKLTVNGGLLDEFLAEPAPCFTLGLVEALRRPRGFLAIRTDDTIPPNVSDAGFNFGHALVGTSDCMVVLFSFEFYGFACYNVLVRPDNPIVRTVLQTIVEDQEYFVFAVDATGSAAVFHANLERHVQSDMTGLKANLPQILVAETTEERYAQVLAAFSANPQPHGRLLHWLSLDDLRYLDLTKDRMEMNPS